jgi:hypothetical protein
MSSLKKYVRPFLVLGLFLGLAINFRSFIMINIIEPIAIMLWASWRIISSVNQNIYWIILIIFCSILMVRLIPVGNDDSSNFGNNFKYSSQSRVEYWQSLISNALMGKDEFEYLRDNLKKLLISLIALEERSKQTNAEDADSLSQIPLPIAIHDFIFPPKGKYKNFSKDYRVQLLFLIPRWFRKWAGKFIRPGNTGIDETLKWMESTMEINRDK